MDAWLALAHLEDEFNKFVALLSVFNLYYLPKVGVPLLAGGTVCARLPSVAAKNCTKIVHSICCQLWDEGVKCVERYFCLCVV